MHGNLIWIPPEGPHSPTLPGRTTMSGSAYPIPQAAREALAALERYQLHLRQLATRWVDAELYHHISVDVQEVRRCCHEVPVLSSGWVALLIAHAELSQALWRAAHPASAPEERQRLLGNVFECIAELERQCMGLRVHRGGHLAHRARGCAG